MLDLVGVSGKYFFILYAHYASFIILKENTKPFLTFNEESPTLNL